MGKLFQLVVACTDQTLSFFAANGKCQNKKKLNGSIRGIDTFIYEPKQYVALLVALEREVIEVSLHLENLLSNFYLSLNLRLINNEYLESVAYIPLKFTVSLNDK